MPRGTALSLLLSQLKAAIGDNATGNTTRDTELKTLLSIEQQTYASSYDFPFLEHRWDLDCAAGSRFLAIPTTTSATSDLSLAALINFDRPVKVEVKFNRIWLQVDYGIDSKDYIFRDSDTDQRVDPIRRWRMASNTLEATSKDNQIEIWPIPATLQTIRFTGQRQLRALTSPTDTCDLDDMLLVYSVAVKKAVRAEFVDEAKMMLGLAKQRELQVRSGYPDGREEVLILGGDDIKSREQKRLLPIQVVA